MTIPAAASRVSVIVPCFNLGEFLDEALASVAAQTHQNFELVVVDDGSTEPRTILALEAAERRGVRVVRTPNRGLSAARNRGIAETTAEFICSLDADDRLHPEWLARALDEFAADSSLDFVSHWLQAFGDETWLWQPERCDLGALVDRNAVNGAAVFRRGMIDRIGGFDESMREGCEDWEFWIRAVAAGCRGRIVPQVMYDYRRRRDSMSVAMHEGNTHARLYATIAGKHHESFARFLPDLLLRREHTIATLTASIDRVSEEIELVLTPAIEERRREVETARARLDGERERQAMRTTLPALERQRDDLARDIVALERQLDALHRSASWRVTAPLRKIYDWLGLQRRS